MNDSLLLEVLADGFDAMSTAIRQRLALLDSDSTIAAAGPTRAVDRARAMHPMLGNRQAEVIAVLERAGVSGTNTGAISMEINYDQPNVYLTLQGLLTRGFVEKDVSTSPHTYRLTQVLRQTPPTEE